MAVSNSRFFITNADARVWRDDVPLLCLGEWCVWNFGKDNNLHVGNIKYQPVNSQKGYAVMGVLIGDPAYRGLGVASETVKESAIWLKRHRDINQIVLGVDKKNEAAIRAYKKAGFQIASTPHIPMCADNVATMVWNI